MEENVDKLALHCNERFEKLNKCSNSHTNELDMRQSIDGFKILEEDVRMLRYNFEEENSFI